MMWLLLVGLLVLWLLGMATATGGMIIHVLLAAAAIVFLWKKMLKVEFEPSWAFLLAIVFVIWYSGLALVGANWYWVHIMLLIAAVIMERQLARSFLHRTT